MPKSHSTDDFSDGPFRPHGRLDVHVEGGICIYRAEGPFNLEAIVALGKARRAVAQEWSAQGRAASIVVFHTSMLMSKDAVDAYTQGMQAHLTQVKPNLGVAWVVSQEVEGRAIMLRYFENIFASLNVPWQAFEELDEAKAWIQSRLNAKRIA